MNFSIESDQSLSDDLREQIKFLLCTPVGTVVCDREFGIDMSFIDKPTLTAETMFAAEVCQKLEKYIPSIKLDNVQFTANEIGDNLIAKVVVKIG